MRRWATEVLERRILLKIPWASGRGIGDYLRYRLFQSERFKFDVYLLYYPQGTCVMPHYDKAPLAGHAHHRVNLELVRPNKGGLFKHVNRGDQAVKAPASRLTHFRPDNARHWVTPITDGYRLVLSVGWLRAEAGE